MTRDYLTNQYELYGEEWTKKLLNNALKKIDSTEDKEAAYRNVIWWCEHCEKQTGNLDLSESEIEKWEERGEIYNKISHLEEFNDLRECLC